jgi:protein tyrosine/serine phosphatase
LLLSTIEAIASKNKSLENLKIKDHLNHMKEYPIIKFDSSRENSLETSILKTLKPYHSPLWLKDIAQSKKNFSLLKQFLDHARLAKSVFNSS